MSDSDTRTLALDIGAREVLERYTIASTVAGAVAAELTLTDPVLLALDRLAQLKVAELVATQVRPDDVVEARNPPQQERGWSAEPLSVDSITRAARRAMSSSTLAAKRVARWRPSTHRDTRPKSTESTADAALPGAAAPSRRSSPQGVVEPPASGPPEGPAAAEGGHGEGGPSGVPHAYRPPKDLDGEPAAVGSADLAGSRWGEREGDLPLASLSAGTPTPELPDGACVMPPRLDGGTRFWIDLTNADIEAMPAAFSRLIADLRRRRTREEKQEERRGGGPLVHVPRRQGSLFDGDHYTASWRATGEDWCRFVSFHVQDMFYVRVEPISPRSGFATRVIVELKARLLHTVMDQREIVGAVLREAHWWLTGDDVRPDQLHELGWCTANIEECADFYKLPWLRDDAVRFVLPNALMKQGNIGKVFGTDPFFAATVMVGTRSSDFSLILYNKSEQIDEVKGGDASTYAAIWRAHGLSDDRMRLVSRAEFRLKGRALRWIDKHTGEVFDLRDPMVASSPEVLGLLWASITRRRVRLFVPGATRRKRCKTDPRWERVREASSAEPHDIMQHREAHEDAHAAALLRAMRQHLIGAQRIAALHDARITTREGYAAITMLAVRRVEELEQQPVVGEGSEYTERGRKYRLQRLPFMGEEIRAARAAIEHERELGNLMPGVDLVAYPETG